MSAEKSYQLPAAHGAVGKTEPSVNKAESTVGFTPPRSRGGAFGNSSGYGQTEPSTNK